MAVALSSGSRPVARTTVDWPSLARPTLAIALVALAYRTSLATLFEAMRLDTPLAHLAMVPFVSIGLAVAVRNNSAGPEIDDRQVDWIIGASLCTVALVINLVLPNQLSTDFWTWRIDLLTLPLFVAGIVTLLFGVRRLWKYRLAVLFLYLAWPYPYTLMLDRWLGEFTQTTIWALVRVLQHIHVAAPLAGSDSVFQVPHNGTSVQLNVASACSGANGMVGFLLVAAAFMLVVRGARWRKAAWLVLGATLVWVLNVVRILVIFWIANRWGEKIAIDGFHPYIGLVVFNIAVGIMILLIRPFGLAMSRPIERLGRATTAAPPGQLPPPTAVAPSAARHPRLGLSLVFVLLVAGSLGALNGELRAYDLVSDSLGSPRLESFGVSRESPTGWALQQTNTYDWAKQFFGQSSTWVRYLYSFGDDPTSALRASVPLTVDVIETGDRASLSNYGVEACYKFHGYSVGDPKTVDLGNGVRGGVLTWTNGKTGLTWTTLYWHWPIRTPKGTRYERVTLVMNDQPTNTFATPQTGAATTKDAKLQGGAPAPITDNAERQRQSRVFMQAFASELIALRAAAPAPADGTH